jgi:pimeloyl-ACP methyl ester carboxylesterase
MGARTARYPFAVDGGGEVSGRRRGSAVLVHGRWGNPGDWQWVRRLLENQGVRVGAPDLSSHRLILAGLAEDANDVRAAIRGCSAPVVVVGWSYGGKVIGLAAEVESSVIRLIYVADVPMPSGDEVDDLSWIQDDPHVIVGDDGMFVLDNDWWLNEEAGATFPPEVVDHLRRNPRRPISLAAMRPQTSTAWRTIPTTVLLGRADQLVSEKERRWASDNLADVRVLETDHFVAFRQPEAISDAVIEALDTYSAR